jgi:hypothetical protein
METTYSFRNGPGGDTVVTLRNLGKPSGFRGVSAPIIAAAMRRATRKDLAKLSSILEQSGPTG